MIPGKIYHCTCSWGAKGCIVGVENNLTYRYIKDLNVSPYTTRSLASCLEKPYEFRDTIHQTMRELTAEEMLEL